MRRAWFIGLVLCAATAAWAADPPKPTGSILFWTPEQQETGYRAAENFFPVRVVPHGAHVYPLTLGAPIDSRYEFQGAHWDSDTFVKANHLSGLLVIKDGRIVVEKYALGRKPDDRWVGFSVGKSVTSLLVGAAIKDGFIKSLDSPVTDCIPYLKGSAYDGVTVRQLLTMTSGVKWNEDYTDPNSDVAKFALPGVVGPDGEDPTVVYMSKLPREAAPGTKFSYKTGESDLIGILVERATHKHLADYLSEKIWAPFGMEKDANWMLASAGSEIGGCCTSMTLRDYGRLGLFVMNGGVAGGEQVIPPDFLTAATTKQVMSDFAGLGYGYQWWTHDDGSFEAVGIFGQSIYINRQEKLVIVTNSAWPEADAAKYYVVTDAYRDAVVKALHAP